MPDATPPRPARSSVILYADVARDGADAVACRVRNLSATGACVDNQAELAEGDRVIVAMGVITPVAADVVWAKPTLAGLRFDREVDLAAARTPRKTGKAASAGWIGGLDDPYRRRA